MDRRLLQPKWLLAHAAVIAIGGLFVFLGFWQLSRHEQRVSVNQVGERRITSEPTELDALLASNPAPANLEYQTVTATGIYNPTHEVLIRSRVHLGTAGFHVITPLVREQGDAILVNRGWIPLTTGNTAPTAPTPPEGTVTVEGWLELSRERPRFGPEDPIGELEVFNRVDIDRISQQLPMDVVPVYLVARGDQGNELPAPVRPPEFTDQGPHLAYAIQWFGFALVGVVGYVFLARRRLREDGSRATTVEP